MQLVSAIVRPAKVGTVCEALQRFGFQGLTVTLASGFGKLRGPVEVYRGVEWSSQFQDQAKFELVVADDDVTQVIDVICSAAATGGMGDGKIWVTPVGEIVRIRTREAGVDAL